MGLMRTIPPILIAALCGRVDAGFLQVWQLKETAAAPVLVVGQVISVQKNRRVPDGSLPWKAETWTMTADIRVLRAYTHSGKPIPAGRLRLNFLAYGPSQTMFICCNPPPLPDFALGRVAIFPLKENGNPASDWWELVADEGVNAIVPSRAEMPDSAPAPATARAFILSEIANALSGGTPGEVFAASSYLASQYEDLASELMPPLESRIGDGRGRWAEVATNILAATGVPRPSVADLFAGGDDLQKRAMVRERSLFIAQAALRKLKASPETDSLLIGTFIADAPVHAWGSGKPCGRP